MRAGVLLALAAGQGLTACAGRNPHSVSAIQPQGGLSMNELPEIHTLWSWPTANVDSSSCRFTHGWRTATALRSGATVRLKAYRTPSAPPTLPSILPKTSITRHRKTGSVALFANRFRYHLLQRGPRRTRGCANNLTHTQTRYLARPRHSAAAAVELHVALSIWLGIADVNLQRGDAIAAEIGCIAGPHPTDRRACSSAEMVGT